MDGVGRFIEEDAFYESHIIQIDRPGLGKIREERWRNGPGVHPSGLHTVEGHFVNLVRVEGQHAYLFRFIVDLPGSLQSHGFASWIVSYQLQAGPLAHLSRAGPGHEQQARTDHQRTEFPEVIKRIGNASDAIPGLALPVSASGQCFVGLS